MAKQAYFDKALTKSEYLLLIDSIEADYMQIVNQLEYREASDLLESYILKLSWFFCRHIACPIDFWMNFFFDQKGENFMLGLF